MASAFGKDLTRSIRKSLGRFVAIAIMGALGAGFFSGLLLTGPDMRDAGDAFYDATNAADFRVQTTLGLSQETIDELSAVEGVEGVMPAYEADVLADVNSSQYAVRMQSLNMDEARAHPIAVEDGKPAEDAYAVSAGNPDYINRPLLIEGEWPDAPNECVMGIDPVMDVPVSIGDKLTVLEVADADNVQDMLQETEYTVTGLVQCAYYNDSTNLGATSLGDGAIDQFVFVPENAFADDLPYTQAFITVAGARGLHASSEEYDQMVDLVVQRVEDLAPELAAQRLNEVKGDAQAELDDARAEYLQEKSDAEEELADAKWQLEDAKALLDDALIQLQQAESEIAQGRAELPAAYQKLQESADLLAKTEVALNNGYAEYENGVAMLAEGKENYETALQTKAALESQLSQAQAGAAEINKKLDQANQAVTAAETALKEAEEALNSASSSDPGYKDLEAQYEQAEAAVTNAKGVQSALKAELDQLNASIAQLDVAINQIDQGIAGLSPEYFAAAEAQLAESKRQLDAGWEQLQAGKREYDKGVRAYNAFVAEFESGVAEYEKGKLEYLDGLAEYQDGLAEYEEGAAEAQEEFAKAEAELADAQQEIDDIELPDVYVLDREKVPGMVTLQSDSERIDAIARVFPFLFFLVAALVSLTTMTRMVDEERSYIGICKALGYGNGCISSKYLVYAMAASGIGSIVGILALSYALPWFIMDAYATVHVMPWRPTPYTPAITLASGGLSVGITTLATYAAVRASLRETPAALMQPRAPKAGKRILLERITPVWKRMSFSWKITARNLFRYKRRFFMAVVGIAGCTALLLIGLGLQNSIGDIIDKQFGKVYHYQMLVRTEDDLTSDQQQDMEDVLSESGSVHGFTRAHSESMIARSNDQNDTKDYRLELVVPEDAAAFQSYVDMHERKTQEPLTLSEDGVVITEKLAKQLDAKVGDTISLYQQDAVGNATGQAHTFTVAGIMENYVGHYLYVMPRQYEDAMGESPVYSEYYAQVSSDPDDRVQLSDALLALDGVKTAGYTDETIDTYETMLETIDFVVIILIGAAALLAFVVLYNLTNINITERIREIATLKVLGFTPREVSAYIHRETLLLSAIGALVGMVLGIWLEGFIVVTAEVDMVMFGRDIHASSFAIAFALTMLFSVIIVFLMRGKLAKVDMVESLKSNE